MNLYTMNLNGHRKSYVDIFEDELDANNVSFMKGLFSKEPLLFLMIEDSFLKYIISCFLRSIFGLTTIGLVFTVKPLIEAKNNRNKLKRRLLISIANFKRVHNVSIIPFYVNKEIETFCSNYIYDPQFWDLSIGICNAYFDSNVEKAILCEHLAQDLDIDATNECKRIFSIGEQSAKKGVSRFIAISHEMSKNDNYSQIEFVFAGKLDETATRQFFELKNERLKGIDRFISDEEIMLCYLMSDVVWCSYDKEYDQASGVFGRALQLGKSVIVREGSILEKICKNEGVRHFSLSNDFSEDELYRFLIESTWQGYAIQQTSIRKNYSINTFKEILRS